MAYQKFWALIVISLFAETYFLFRWTDFSLKKTIPIILLANAASAATGISISLGNLYTDNLLMQFKPFSTGIGMMIFDFLLIFSVSLLVETLIVRYFYKGSWTRLLFIMSTSNITTHILGWLLFVKETT